MAPIFIADSDDESEADGHFSPPNPQPGPGTSAQAATRSSDQGSLATASTDPVFFQSVFNEQNEAACEQARGSQRGLLKEDIHQSSAVTVPDVPYQRTTNGFYLSSITSVTDPNTENFQEASIGKVPNEWTQVTSPGRGQKEVDPWDVPSSPEGPKLSRKPLKSCGPKTKGQASGQVGLSITNDAAAESPWDFHNGVEGRDIKRRRLAEPQASPRASNDVNLVAIPSSNGLEGDIETMAASSIPLPTLPIDSESPFFIPPQMSTDPQQQSMNPGVNFAFGGVGTYNNLLLQQQTLYAVGSSGTATNVNTPRSQMFSPHNFSSMAPEESGREAAAKTGECRPIGQRRDSSPDIISTMAPELDSKSVRDWKSESEQCADTNYIIQSKHEPCDRGVPEALVEPPPHELQSGDNDVRNDADLVTKQAAVTKSKKRRGRPRKNPEYDESQSTKPVDCLASENEVPPITTQKKKRGRPKKPAPPAAAKSAPPPAASASAAVVDVDTKAIANVDVVPKNDDAPHALKIDDGAEEPKGEEPVEKRPLPMAENTRNGQEGRATATEKGDMGLQDAPEKPNDAGQREATGLPSAQGREERPEGNKMKKGSSTPVAAKPLYRVGLSKRWKIAPLLKSVRKS